MVFCVAATRWSKDMALCLSVPRAEEFNVVSNYPGHRQMCDFHVLDKKYSFWAKLVRKVKIVRLGWNFGPIIVRGVLGAGSNLRVGWRGGGWGGRRFPFSVDFYWCWANFHFRGGGGNGRWAVFLVSFSDFPNIS